MCNGNNHLPGCRCGWGNGTAPVSVTVKGGETTSKGASTTRPTSCFWCHKPGIYFHRNENGGSVLLDKLGPPWPIHECWLNRTNRERSEFSKRIGIQNTHKRYLTIGDIKEKSDGTINGQLIPPISKSKPIMKKVGTYGTLSRLFSIKIYDGSKLFEVFTEESIAKKIKANTPVFCRFLLVKPGILQEKVAIATEVSIYGSKSVIFKKIDKNSCFMCKKPIENEDYCAIITGYKLICHKCDRQFDKKALKR